MKKLKWALLFFVIHLFIFSCGEDDDTTPDITVSATDFATTIDENPAAGTSLGTVQATTNQGSVTFSVSSQTPGGALAIDESSGELTVADATVFDFETNPTITGTVQASNGGVTDNASVTITLNNVNETATTVTANDFSTSVSENPAADQLLGTLDASTNSGSLTYSITSQTPSGALSIDATGAITVADPSQFDFETNPSITAVVNVANGNISDDSQVNISLEDVTEPTLYSEITVNGSHFSSRIQHQVVVFNDKIWVIAGLDNDNSTNDVWSSEDGITWTEETANAAFSARYGHQVIEFDGKLWLVGGRDDNLVDSYVSDVWNSSDGITWTQVTTDGGFPGRERHQLYIVGNKIFLTTGFSGGGYFNDIWSTVDGQSWTQESANAAFSSRELTQVVNFDGKYWLVSGDFKTDVFNSTDGITWTEVTSSAPFSARQRHQVLVLDGKMWLIGGNTANGDENDIWSSIDGATWTTEEADPAFSERNTHQAVVFQNKIWVIGGTGSGGFLNDIWTSH